MLTAGCTARYVRRVHRVWSLVLLAVVVLAPAVHAASSTPLALSPDGTTLWVVNPDSDSLAKIDAASNTRVGEIRVGRHPRTVAVTSGHLYVADQLDDAVTRLDADGSNPSPVALTFGCAPYGVLAGPGGDVYVSCQGTSDLLVLDANLSLVRRIPLAWPEARGLALGADGKVYVTHFVTKEPNHSGHVSEVDPAAGTVTRVLAIAPDHATCETSGGGQGVANLLSAIAVVPAGAPAAVAGQLWVGGTLHNSLQKGLFERSRFFKDDAKIGLFPDLDLQSNPAGEGAAARRNIYKPALHDIARAAIWKLDLSSGTVVGEVDVAGGGSIAAIAFSPAGDVAHVVDQFANGYYVFRTERGQGASPSAVFGRVVNAAGPGGASPSAPCTGDAGNVVAEDPYVLSPQARLVATGGMDPLDAASLMPANTGLDFAVVDRPPCTAGSMCPVPDGVGTTPAGVVLSGDGGIAYVANYLARNVAVVNATPAGFGCQGAPATACATRLECPGGAECMPLVRAVVPSTTMDLLQPEILDGKILFTTTARDAAAPVPVPPFNRLTHDGALVQGEVTSTARDGASLSCASCHADFGGQDGRTWDFSQFGSSLRNTMDLRGRASFAPGTCSNDASVSCTFDAACGPYGSGAHCVNNKTYIPPNILPQDRANYFNPMGSTHWNGDRDEVEDFEFTLRELTGAAECDGVEENPQACVGALVLRRFVGGAAEAHADLGQPNRNLSPRLNHLADYVYSLTAFPRNPSLGPDGATPSAAAVRGRALFNDPVVHCSFCHNGPSSQNQQFTSKGPNGGYDVTQTPRADLNSPFVRFDVGTTNVFDETNPYDIASDRSGLLGFTLFQNEQIPEPANRSKLNAYIPPLLNDVWNTAPYLHDGTAATLLDVVRACIPALEDCFQAGRGRNFADLHGVTSILSARQLNDLVAFQKAPHGPVGEFRAVNGVRLKTLALKAHFGRKPGKDALAMKGSADLSSSQSLDPASEPVTVSIGVPSGETLTIFERTIPPGAFKANRSHTSFRFADRRGSRVGGLRSLALKVKGGSLAFRLAARTDLSAIRVSNPDYTVALEVGDDTVAITRHFVTNKKGTVTRVPPSGRRPRRS